MALQNTSTNKLQDLALRLTINHITNSITDYSDTQIASVLNGIDPKVIKQKKKDCRYVLIIGAGASHAVNSKIPLASTAADQIRSVIEGKNDISIQLIERELQRLEKVFKLDRADFETKLFAISRFFPDEVRDELVRKFGKRFEVGLFYEIAGHMLKHRFIDVIINYNFDELLDNVIEDEITSSNFSTIFSDGQCPKESEYDKEVLNEEKQGLRFPLYIKPHGTISHPSTLQYTRDDYFNTSNEISNLLEKLLAAKNRPGQEPYEINLIVVGFGMKSFELNELIKKTHLLDCAKKRKIKIHLFDVSNEKNYKKNLDKDILDLFEFSTIPINNGSPDIHQSFKTLWKSIWDLYKVEYKPKGIERHRLISVLFSDKETLVNGYDKGNELKYFEDRVRVEALISILNSDGLLNSTQIRDSRLGKYFTLYKKFNGHLTLSRFLGELGVFQYKGFVSDTFMYQSPKDFNDTTLICQILFKKLSENLQNPEVRERLEANRETVLTNILPSLKKRNLLSISHDENIIYEPKFEALSKSSIIKNDLHWSILYQQELAKDWDLLLGISEQGRFLFNEKNIELFKNKKAEVILSSYAIDEFDLKPQNSDKFNLLSDKPLKLPWWLHNQHLVIFLKKTTKRIGIPRYASYELQSGFYYSSRLLSRRVTPVYMDDQGDLERLLHIFVNYWYRATEYKNGKTIKDIQSYEMLQNQIDKLLTIA